VLPEKLTGLQLV